MRYAAFAAIVFGVVAACYAGFRYVSGGPPDEVENLSAARLAVLLVFAACMVVGGVLLWVVGQKDYTESRRSAVSSRTREPEIRTAAGMEVAASSSCQAFSHFTPLEV
jgi:hypothetical protein